MKNTKVLKGKLANYWFDKDGILYCTSKEAPRTLENIQENFEFVKRITKNKKACLIANNTHTSTYEYEILKYTIGKLPAFYKAMAIVSSSPLGHMLANFSVVLKPAHSIPIKKFKSVSEAKQWIIQYL